MRFPSVPIVCAAFLMLLTGCTQDVSGSPAATVAEHGTTTPTATVLTEAAALEIGVAAYERYLVAQGEFINSGGKTRAEYETLVTNNMLEKINNLETKVSTNDFSTDGQIIIFKTKLEQLKAESIMFYACLDMSESKMFDAQGKPVGAPREGSVQSAEVRVVDLTTNPKIDEVKMWEPFAFCKLP